MAMGDHHDGLRQDLPRLDALIERRRALGWLAGAGAMAVLPGSTVLQAEEQARCVALPWETAGPYPGYGGGWTRPRGATSNVLGAEGIVRSDIRASFIGSRKVAAGAPISLTLDLVDALGCAPLTGHAVYLWQCDGAGLYSLYTAPDESYLRGVQASDARGQVRFSTIVPGCYDVRYPHIHVQVFASMEAAMSGSRPLVTSQLIIPAAMARDTYADARAYPGSADAFERFPIDRDGVFRDNSPAQIAAMTISAQGSAAKGYEARARVAIA